LFLDHPKNSEYPIDDVKSRTSTIQGVHKSNALIVKLSESGSLDATIVNENTENCVLPQKKALMLNDHTMIVYMFNQREKEQRFATITLK
jgi:hypothetical protein